MEILKKIRTIDFIIVAGIIIALIVGFFTFKHFRQTADKQIEATSQISFDVFIRGITYTGSDMPIHKGDKTFISIRNVPYSDLEITNVKIKRRQMALSAIPAANERFALTIIEDPSMENLYDIMITLTDTAKITKDGAVVGGNKIKIGLPITLEGKDYKFNGTVSNVQLMHYDAENKMGANINTTDDIQ